MPAFVIYALGQPARVLVADRTVVRIGRHPISDILLHGSTVSREHANFVKAPDGSWTVRRLSQTNPMVVDGSIISRAAPVAEGAEIVIGGEHVIIFAEDANTAKKYLDGPLITKSTCTSCGWKGVVSLTRTPVCLHCGGTTFVRADQPRHTARTSEEETSPVSTDQMRGLWRKIKEAKQSFLERLDSCGINRKRLSENQPFEIGPSSPFPLRLDGLTMGSITIRWNGHHYVVESEMKFPSLKVNGSKMTATPLTSGDVVEVGSNRFRFVTE